MSQANSSLVNKTGVQRKPTHIIQEDQVSSLMTVRQQRDTQLAKVNLATCSGTAWKLGEPQADSLAFYLSYYCSIGEQ